MDPFELEPWRDAIAALRVLCPLSCKVSITRIRMPSGSFGDCDKRSGRFYIRVERNIGLHHSLLVLVHEYAHAMTWELYKRRDGDHTAHFGVALAECYRAIWEEAEKS